MGENLNWEFNCVMITQIDKKYVVLVNLCNTNTVFYVFINYFLINLLFYIYLFIFNINTLKLLNYI